MGEMLSSGGCGQRPSGDRCDRPCVRQGQQSAARKSAGTDHLEIDGSVGAVFQESQPGGHADGSQRHQNQVANHVVQQTVGPDGRIGRLGAWTAGAEGSGNHPQIVHQNS